MSGKAELRPGKDALTRWLNNDREIAKCVERGVDIVGVDAACPFSPEEHTLHFPAEKRRDIGTNGGNPR